MSGGDPKGNGYPGNLNLRHMSYSELFFKASVLPAIIIPLSVFVRKTLTLVRR